MTIKGKDVLKLKQIGSVRKDKNDEPYYVFSHQGKGFTAREEFHSAWKDGNVCELDLGESSYERTGDDGKTETVQSWREDGFITYTQMKGVVRNESELKQIEKAATEFSLENEVPAGVPTK